MTKYHRLKVIIFMLVYFVLRRTIGLLQGSEDPGGSVHQPGVWPRLRGWGGWDSVCGEGFQWLQQDPGAGQLGPSGFRGGGGGGQVSVVQSWSERLTHQGWPLQCTGIITSLQVLGQALHTRRPVRLPHPGQHQPPGVLLWQVLL